MSLLIRGGRVLDPSRNIFSSRDLWIEEEKILELTQPNQIPPKKSDQVIDAKDLIVAPGFVDLHVHLRDPGQTEKEDMESGTLAAVAGGFTSILCMPNTSPPNDSPKITEQILKKAKEVGHCRVYPVGAITRGLKGEEVTEIEALHRAGCIAFSDDGRPVNDPHLLRQAMEKTRKLKVPLIEHCEELTMEPTCSSETVDATRALTLACELKAQVHLAHLSCGATVELVKMYKKAWSGITSEVTPHHLFLTEDAVEKHGTNAKMYPPLRHKRDQKELQQALLEGTIDCVATDHAPHTKDEKSRSFKDAPNGIIGLETAFSVLMTLVNQGILPLERAIEVLTIKPAKIVGIEAGSLSPGQPADVTIFDPKCKRRLTETALRSKSSNTPMLGAEMFGKILYTFVAGKLKFSEAA